ncbi:MAG: L,D-transpeptidase family protein [Candidatus Omnitrophota bacterium]|nr:L,D-transpeptidase family protein [Candidatus Omnitrophota bacterium]
MKNRLIFIIAGIIFIAALTAAAVFKFNQTKKDIALENEVQFKTETEAPLLAEAVELEKKSDFVGLKSVYQKLINDFSGNKDVGTWQKKLDETNIKIILSSQAVPGLSQEYIIQPLDNLTKISKQFYTTIDLIKRINNLASDKINPGKKLKIWTGKFSVLTDKSQNILMLKCNDEIIKTYNVSTGLNNSTPVGTFKITTKLVNPVWYKSGAVVPPDSPENILGTRWMGFDLEGYGIHGTTSPESIGKQATAGCVRMLNNEVEELYTFLPQGTEVTIVD